MINLPPLPPNSLHTVLAEGMQTAENPRILDNSPTHGALKTGVYIYNIINNKCMEMQMH